MSLLRNTTVAPVARAAPWVQEVAKPRFVAFAIVVTHAMRASPAGVSSCEALSTTMTWSAARSVGRSDARQACVIGHWFHT